MTPAQIALELTHAHQAENPVRKWSAGRVRQILRNRMYCGQMLYNKTSSRLNKPRKPNPENEWIVTKDAFPAIVSANDFSLANRYIQLRRVSSFRCRRQLAREVEERVESELVAFLDSENYWWRWGIVVAAIPKVSRSGVALWHFPRPSAKAGLLGVALDPEDLRSVKGYVIVPCSDFRHQGISISENNPMLIGTIPETAGAIVAAMSRYSSEALIKSDVG